MLSSCSMDVVDDTSPATLRSMCTRATSRRRSVTPSMTTRSWLGAEAAANTSKHPAAAATLVHGRHAAVRAWMSTASPSRLFRRRGLRLSTLTHERRPRSDPAMPEKQARQESPIDCDLSREIRRRRCSLHFCVVSCLGGRGSSPMRSWPPCAWLLLSKVLIISKRQGWSQRRPPEA